MLWLEKFDLEKMLEDNQGLVIINNFLPQKVAEGALIYLKELTWDNDKISNGVGLNDLIWLISQL